MRILVALGGNALLRRGEALSAVAQQAAIELAANVLAQAIQAGHRLIITHGNGPQVGLLALQSASGPADAAMPLDVLGAESEGWIGYALELALRNALPKDALVVTIITQTLVDAEDPAFVKPTKPIGPVYDEATAHRLAELHHWFVALDGQYWRRVVASPKPLKIIELASISRLVNHHATVICGGGGGVPVCARADGVLRGIEAVIDKDATSAMLAQELQADMFIMLSDVDGVYLNYGGASQRRIASARPDMLAAQAASFQAGSMGPKVEAACEFARGTGCTASIGALADLMDIIAGRKGTVISLESPECRLIIGKA
jgi:carbamate kinase